MHQAGYPPLHWISIAFVSFLLLWKLTSRKKKQPVQGSVFITGCDSGMGEITAIHLAKKGFHVFAGVYLDESFVELPKKAKTANESDANITPIKIDVTKEESIQQAAKEVEKLLKTKSLGLVGIINCAGVGYSGPSEYFPLSHFRRQLEVNLIGYVAVTQAFLPLVKDSIKNGQVKRRGRVIYIGTGGGVPAPSPALLSAYMASKWGVEAFCQSLRLEMKLVNLPIGVCMINPGFVKPTGLVAGGKALTEQTWKLMPPRAREEYGPLLDAFTKFSDEQPGTHPRYVAYAMEEAMTAGIPSLRYKVGFDSKVSPIVGLLPTDWRDFLLSKTYGK